MLYQYRTRRFSEPRVEVSNKTYGVLKPKSCDCIVKETVWNRSEKVNHLACVLQGSGIIKNEKKFRPVSVKLQTLYTERCIRN